MSDMNEEQALSAVEKVVNHYKENAKKGERLGKMIDRMGFDAVQEALSRL